METKAIATLIDGSKVSGVLTTEHAASSYGQPVFVDATGQAYDWIAIKEIASTQAGATSERKAQASRENGRKGGRPRKAAFDPTLKTGSRTGVDRDNMAITLTVDEAEQYRTDEAFRNHIAVIAAGMRHERGEHPRPHAVLIFEDGKDEQIDVVS